MRGGPSGVSGSAPATASSPARAGGGKAATGRTIKTAEVTRSRAGQGAQADKAAGSKTGTAVIQDPFHSGLDAPAPHDAHGGECRGLVLSKSARELDQAFRVGRGTSVRHDDDIVRRHLRLALSARKPRQTNGWNQ